jgi:hypothetical protein
MPIEDCLTASRECYGLMMRSRDTSEKAAAIADEVNRALTPEQRLMQAWELSEFLREMAKAALRSRHPEYTEDEVHRALTIQLYGVTPRRQ